jgi:hypothetical protein
MPEAQPTPDLAAEEAQIDSAILDLLLGHGNQRPWSTDEVIREHGSQRNALDGIARLHGSGLIHRTPDGFVWATRAAIRADEIAL